MEGVSSNVMTPDINQNRLDAIYEILFVFEAKSNSVYIRRRGEPIVRKYEWFAGSSRHNMCSKLFLKNPIDTAAVVPSIENSSILYIIGNNCISNKVSIRLISKNEYDIISKDALVFIKFRDIELYRW